MRKNHLLVLFVLAVIVLSACSSNSSEQKENDIDIYQTNRDSLSLFSLDNQIELVDQKISANINNLPTIGDPINNKFDENYHAIKESSIIFTSNSTSLNKIEFVYYQQSQPSYESANRGIEVNFDGNILVTYPRIVGVNNKYMSLKDDYNQDGFIKKDSIIRQYHFAFENKHSNYKLDFSNLINTRGIYIPDIFNSSYIRQDSVTKGISLEFSIANHTSIDIYTIDRILESKDLNLVFKDENNYNGIYKPLDHALHVLTESTFLEFVVKQNTDNFPIIDFYNVFVDKLDFFRAPVQLIDPKIYRFDYQFAHHIYLETSDNNLHNLQIISHIFPSYLSIHKQYFYVYNFTFLNESVLFKKAKNFKANLHVESSNNITNDYYYLGKDALVYDYQSLNLIDIELYVGTNVNPSRVSKGVNPTVLLICLILMLLFFPIIMIVIIVLIVLSNRNKRANYEKN